MAIVIPFGHYQPNRRIQDMPLLPAKKSDVVQIEDYLARKEARGYKDVHESSLVMAHLARDYVQCSSFRTHRATVKPINHQEYAIIADEYAGLEDEIKYVSKFFFKPESADEETVQFLSLLISLAPYELEIYDSDEIEPEMLRLLKIIFQDEIIIVS